MVISDIIKQKDREINDTLMKQLNRSRTNGEIVWKFWQRYFISLGNRVVN